MVKGATMRKLALKEVLLTAVIAVMALPIGAIRAAEIKVISSASFKPAFNDLATVFEKQTNDKVSPTWSGTVGIPKKIAAGEIFDVVIIWAPTMDALGKDGRLIAGTRIPVAKSGIGVAVRAGAPKIDLSSAHTLKAALLAAKSIAYSTGPSGIYLEDLFRKWGISTQSGPKLMQIPPGRPIGEVVAAGEAEVGFQQVSELLPIKGIDFQGPLPADVQEITVLSGAVLKTAPNPDAAKALLKFLSSPQSALAIKHIGMEPG
jgi:molybdate transport system substrate-binding protein